jgi:hypothetical protein
MDLFDDGCALLGIGMALFSAAIVSFLPEERRA